MGETREVTLTLCLPLDIADQVEDVHAGEPEFLKRVLFWALTRRSIYSYLRERSWEGTDDVAPGDTAPIRSVSVQPIPEEEGRAILAENRIELEEVVFRCQDCSNRDSLPADPPPSHYQSCSAGCGGKMIPVIAIRDAP